MGVPPTRRNRIVLSLKCAHPHALPTHHDQGTKSLFEHGLDRHAPLLLEASLPALGPIAWVWHKNPLLALTSPLLSGPLHSLEGAKPRTFPSSPSPAELICRQRSEPDLRGKQDPPNSWCIAGQDEMLTLGPISLPCPHSSKPEAKATPSRPSSAQEVAYTTSVSSPEVKDGGAGVGT